MNKTEEEILGWCKKEGGHAWLSSIYFYKKINKTKDTVARNLKVLFDKGVLERKAIRDKGKWYYYYRLKEEKRNGEKTKQ